MSENQTVIHNARACDTNLLSCAARAPPLLKYECRFRLSCMRATVPEIIVYHVGFDLSELQSTRVIVFLDW